MDMLEKDSSVGDWIFECRGQHMISDKGLERIWDFEVRKINQLVRRNYDRFPEGSVIRLSDDETAGLKSYSPMADFLSCRSHGNPMAFSLLAVTILYGLMRGDRATPDSLKQLQEAFRNRRKTYSEKNRKYWERMSFQSSITFCRRMMELTDGRFDEAAVHGYLVETAKFDSAGKLAKSADPGFRRALESKSPFPTEIKGVVYEHWGEGVFQPMHLMHKLEPIRDTASPIVFEFLVEYGLFESSVGIYYGCKCVWPDGFDTDEAVGRANELWDTLRAKVLNALNRTFMDLDFTNRFKVTNNASNRTYWPFWITLIEGEDIVNVGMAALKIIRWVFERNLSGCDDSCDDSYCPVGHNYLPNTRFTDDAWELALASLDDGTGKRGKAGDKREKGWKRKRMKRSDDFVKLIDKCVEKGWLERVHVNGPDDHAFRMTDEIPVRCKGAVFIGVAVCVVNQGNRMFNYSPAWDCLARIFIGENGELLTPDNLKNIFSLHLKKAEQSEAVRNKLAYLENEIREMVGYGLVESEDEPYRPINWKTVRERRNRE